MLTAARILLYTGIVGVVLGLSKAHATWIADPAYDYTGSSRFAWSIAYIVLLAVSAYGAGLPDVPRTVRNAVLTSIGAASGAAVAVSIVQLGVGDALLPRFVVFGAALLLVPWYLLCTGLATGLRSRELDRDRVLLVGSDEEVAMLEEELERSPERLATLVAAVRPGEVSTEGLTAELSRAATDAGATVVVLDREAQASPRIVDQVAALHESGVRVRTLSLFYEEWLGKLPLSELERVSLMFDIGELHRARYGRAARVLDVACSVAGAVVLLALLPFVLIGDLLGNRGRLFYSQPRVGKNGREFRILKFRTMRAGGESASTWTSEDDPRITSFGRFLRTTHIDELPQVLNILRGDLSVVGPRPEQPPYVEELTEKVAFYDLRHLVRPGVTGWAQVKYHYGSDEEDALEKLQYEFYYLRHQSVSLDTRIVARTVRSVFRREGR